MPRQKFALEKGGPKRLDVRRSWLWGKTEVRLDGKPLHPPIPDRAALRAGRQYQLPDGRWLLVSFLKQFGGGGLSLTLDGRPVPGAANDPRMTIRSAAKLLWFLAGLNMVVGLALASLAPDGDALVIGSLVFGGVLAGLGFAVWRYRSRIAIVAAVVVEIADLIAILALSPGPPPIGAIVLRGMIVVVLVRAYNSVKAAERLELDERADAAFS